MQKIIILALMVGILAGAYMFATRNAAPTTVAETDSVVGDNDPFLA